MEIMVKKYDAILFDLDGTLLDSLEDMKDSVNHVMREFGFPVAYDRGDPYLCGKRNPQTDRALGSGRHGSPDV